MISLGPQLVTVPDGRIGCLVARQGMSGCVEFGGKRILETYNLGILEYFQPPTVTVNRVTSRR